MHDESPRISEPVRPLRRTEYEQLADAGAFENEERVELLDGVIYNMSPVGAVHARVTARLTKRLILALRDDLDVITQGSFAATPLSMPEPDIAVVAVELTRPRRASLIVEVSETSLARDRYKAQIYATARVPEYWIVDLPRRSVEVYTEPRAGRYAKLRLETIGAVLCPCSLPAVAITLDDGVLPAPPPARRRTRKR
jgi:Uma2 family endonuclease